MERPAHLSARECSQAVRSSVRKSLARDLAVGISLAVLACAGAGLAAMRATGVDAHALAMVTLVAITAGLIASLAIAFFAAAKMSSVAAESLDLLF